MRNLNKPGPIEETPGDPGGVAHVPSVTSAADVNDGDVIIFCVDLSGICVMQRYPEMSDDAFQKKMS